MIQVYFCDSEYPQPSQSEGVYLLFGDAQSETRAADLFRDIMPKYRKAAMQRVSERLDACSDSWLAKLRSTELVPTGTLDYLASASLVSEKANLFKSPYLNDLLTRAVVEEWIRDKAMGSNFEIQIQVTDPELRALLEPLAVPRAPTKRMPRLWSAFSRISTRALALLFFLRAVAWLVAVGPQITKKPRHEILDRQSEVADVIVVDYFFNPRLESERYVSQYWGGLLSSQVFHGKSVQEVLIFAPSETARSPRKARKILRRFGSSKQFLHEDLSARDILETLKLLGSLTLSFMREPAPLPHEFIESVSKQLYRDFLQSFVGPLAARHLLDRAAWEGIFSSRHIASNGTILFLAEGQGWETVMLRTLAGTGWKACAYYHSSVKAWDLRGYSGVSSPAHSPLLSSTPKPYLRLANSKRDQALLRERDYGSRVEVVEALRFSRYPEISRQPLRSSEKKAGPLRILGVAGYSLKRSQHLANLLSEAEKLSTQVLRCSFLPHPALAGKKFKGRQVPRVDGTPLATLLEEFDVVVVDSETTAGIDALLAGKPVVILASLGELITSPIAEVDRVNTCYTAARLVEEVESFLEHPVAPALPDDLRPSLSEEGDYDLWAASLGRDL